MDQGEGPAEQQRHGEHYEEVAHVDAGGVGRQEYREESEDGDECGAEQWHGGAAADAGKGLAPGYAAAEVDKDAVDDDNGIVDEHAHGENKRAERYALHSAPEVEQEEERPQHYNDERHANYHSAAQPHGEHEDEDDDGHRFGKVDKESGERIGDALRLVEHAVHLDAGGQSLLPQLGKHAVDLLAHLDDVGAVAPRHEDAY